MAAILKKRGFSPKRMDLYEIQDLGRLVCGSQLVEQSDNLGQNELTLKNVQCCYAGLP